MGDIFKKASDTSPTAQGSAMSNSVPRLGDAPSKTNDQQPAIRNTDEHPDFRLKGLAWKKVTTGY